MTKLELYNHINTNKSKFIAISGKSIDDNLKIG